MFIITHHNSETYIIPLGYDNEEGITITSIEPQIFKDEYEIHKYLKEEMGWDTNTISQVKFV